MNVVDVLVWGFGATVVLTMTMRLSQALSFTRIDIPFILGTAFTVDRDRAKVLGTVIHLVNGWLFAILYAAALETAGITSALLGGAMGSAIGLVHGGFVLAVGLPLIPAVHPRMATDGWGPEPARQLEPPGFLALHYGRRTPIVSMVAHVLYGAILGTFYTLT